MSYDYKSVLTRSPEWARKEGIIVTEMQEKAWNMATEVVDRLVAGDGFRLKEVQLVSIARSADDGPLINLYMVESDDIRVDVTWDPTIDSSIVIHCIDANTGKTLVRRKVYAVENFVNAVGCISARAVMDEWNAVKSW